MSNQPIGRPMARVGGVDRVTGAQEFTADISLDGVLQVKLVSLPCARARILSVDTDLAMEVEGVVSVMTAANLPHPMPRCGPNFRDRPILATGETKYFGEPVAAVAAETEDAARQAAGLVLVHYEELPPVLTVDQALDPGSPLVQDPEIRVAGPYRQTNILNEWHFGWGDVNGSSVECVIENDYCFPMVTHFAIEPHAYLARADAEGVTIWSPTQHPYVLQRVVAESLEWPISRVRIIAPDPGGAFGGKGWPKFEPMMAYLSLLCGRPVRLVLTLEETFQAVRRASARVHIRTGFHADGRIAFQDIESNFLIGAYADVGNRVTSKASYVACGPYKTPNARVVARAVLSHTTPSTAFRGFGTPQSSWAVESQMDQAAVRLGIDRAEIRQRNLPNQNEEFIPGDTPCDGDWQGMLRTARELIQWDSQPPAGSGKGIAIGIKSSATASVSFTMVRLHADGSASVFSGTSDMGQGARTVFTQIASRELGIPMERITMVMGDTTVVPYDSSTSASRSTVFMGNAIVKACADIKSQLRSLAAEGFDVPEDTVAVEGGVVRIPGRDLSFPTVLKQYYGSSRGEITGVGSSRSKFLSDHPLGGRPAFWETMCVAAEVNVDCETGMVKIPRLVLIGDVGKALNPLQVETQDEGSAIMGLGHTLMEQLLLDEHGRILNLGALDYRIPTIQDIPDEICSALIENEDGPGPYGSKGAGEGGTLSVAAAVASAIRQATGIAIRDLPLTPERIWQSIQARLPDDSRNNLYERDQRQSMSDRHEKIDEFFGNKSTPIRWDSEEERKLHYWFDDLHCPQPISPMWFDVGGWWLTCGYMFRRFGVPFGKDWVAKNIKGYVMSAVVPRDEKEESELSAYYNMVMPVYADKFLGWWKDRYLPEILRNFQFLDSYKMEGASLPELMILLEDALDIQERHFRLHWILNLAQFQSSLTFERIFKEMIGDNGELIGRILVSDEDRNWDSVRDLWKMKETVKKSPVLLKAFTNQEPAAIMETLKTTPEGNELWKKIDTHRTEYGNRSMYTHEYTSVTWREDPTPIIALLRGYISSDYDFEDDVRKLRESRASAIEEMWNLFPSERPQTDRDRLARALDLALKMTPLTPDHHFYMDQGTYARVRLVFIAIGNELVRQGVFEASDDVLFLRYHELRVLSANFSAYDAKALVKERRATRVAAAKEQPPLWAGTITHWSLYEEPYKQGLWGWPDVYTREKERTQQPVDTLKGLGASAGVVEGVARIVESAAQFDQVQKDEILVCKMTNPAWVALFTKIGGLITDSGGALSHAAVVSREFGIPAVVGTRSATQDIKTGQRVRVDGASGTITILP